MCIAFDTCLVAAVSPIGTLALSSIESTSTESGQNMVAIFFKYFLVANVKLVLAGLFLRLFLVRLVFMGTVFPCLSPSIISFRLGSSLSYKANLLSS